MFTGEYQDMFIIVYENTYPLIIESEKLARKARNDGFRVYRRNPAFPHSLEWMDWND